MEINEKQYAKIAKYLPRQRGNVSMSNLQLINAILYVTENGCKWRALPKSYGNWHTVYMRMNRWSKNGVLQRVFEGLQQENIICIRMEAICLDSTSVKVHPHGTGALKKTGSKVLDAHAEDSLQRFIWSPHLTVRLFRSRSHQETPPMDRKGESY
ncbi:hypothetical protein SDC9_179308 [bioreactor metagenome]|uniref:Insertion element IS402-like domain-containing protein n=1 Tax=bioreactor metagenome TaxID=1076179 RepID=A0A645H7P5_9ZZZZ